MKEEGPLICFLDFDGVINSLNFDSSFYGFETKYDFAIDSESISLLNLIYEHTGCDFVITSSHRYKASVEDFTSLFREYGFKGRFIDKTPFLKFPCFRGNEVAQWLSCNTHSGYVILDDFDCFFRFQPLVRTSVKTGITLENAQEAIKILKKGLKNILTLE